MRPSVNEKSRVVVGVNGSAHSSAAVEIGANEAILRGKDLHLVHVIEWPDIDLPIGSSPSSPVIGKHRRRAQDILTDEFEHARDVDSALPVTTEVIVDATRRALVEASRTASLLVVGRRPGIATYLPDPIGAHLAAHAMSPVIIALGVSEVPANIVAGLDGVPASPGVLEFAFQEALLRHTGVTVTQARARALYDVAAGGAGGTHDEPEPDQVLTEPLAGVQSTYPDVEVRTNTTDSPAQDAFVQASMQAQMLVIGCGADRISHHIHATSLIHGLLRQAMCPVAVIPQRALTS